MSMGWLVSLGVLLCGAAIPAAWHRPRVWLGLHLSGSALAFVAALTSCLDPGGWEWRGSFLIGGEAPHARLDGVSGCFLVLVAVIGALGSVYAQEYWSDREHPDSAGRGRAWWSALVVCLMLVLICSNGLHFLIAWEGFALSAYFLVTLDRDRVESRLAGWLYLVSSHAGTLALFAFFALVAARTGSWDLEPWRERGELAPLFWIALLGFGVKAGLFPLHIWLPSAHASAPSHVSAIMSGVAIKMGLYGIVRFGGWLPLPPGAGWAVVTLGAVSAVVGAAFAFAQDDLKRLLAYCSVENVGVILVGVGVAMLGRGSEGSAWGYLALVGALLHVWNHGLAKSLLFFSAGSVLHATRTREISRLGGLWRVMPWTAGLFALGAVAMAALPPLNGFVSEWLIYLGLLESTVTHKELAKMTIPAVIALGITGALALAGFVKAAGVVFLGAPRSRRAAEAHECGGPMRVSMVLLAAACVGIGLFPVLAWWVVARACRVWNPSWASIDTPSSILVLGGCHVAVIVLATVALRMLWIRIRRQGRRPALTWDCGFAAPSARMQYTGGSFAGILVGWLRRPMRARLHLRRPRGLFPEAAFRLERVPETVLEDVLGPVAEWVMAASGWMRRRQHGRLPDYILYLVAGLVAVGLLVLLQDLS